MEPSLNKCDVCAQAFEARFRYQVREEQGRYIYICSLDCQQKLLSKSDGGCQCDVCGHSFQLEFPYQVRVSDGARVYYCTPACRMQSDAKPQVQGGTTPIVKRKDVRRIAVFNHKGGTGKTTTAVNIAAGLAERGQRVLLIDADGQGNVGASLGVRGQKTLYHVLVHGAAPSDVVIPVRNELDVITSNELLAAAELFLAERPNRDRIMRERLGTIQDAYDVVVIDCAPALSLMNQNALVYADSVIIPVACDYLSLIGVKQVLKTIRNIRNLLQHHVNILGVLPTFYDIRNRIAEEAFETLQKHFGDRCYEPIRINTKLREAPSVKKTIFEHAPLSHGAEDYLRLVDRILREQAQAVAPDINNLEEKTILVEPAAVRAAS